MSKVYLFAYGTLKKGHVRDISVMFSGKVEFFKNGTLFNYALMYSPKDTYPYIIQSTGDEVKGEIWRVEPEVIAYLDKIEGLESDIFRRKQSVISATTCYYYVGSKIHQIRMASAKPILEWTREFEKEQIEKELARE